MSRKVPEEIDLNSVAVPVGRENEGNNEVNGREAASSTGGAERIVDKVEDSRKDKLGKESEMESVKHGGIDLEADVEPLGDDVDDKLSAGLSSGGVSSMEVDGGSRERRDKEGVSMEDKKPVVGAAGDESKEQTSVNVNQSGIARDSGSGDAKPGLKKCLTLENQNVSPKEECSSRLETQDMDIDTPDDTGKSQATANRGERGEVLQKAGKGSNLFNDVGELNSCTSSDEDESSEVDAKPKKPEEPELLVSDLVWAKVRSHPWWPGQIFDRSAATTKAKKYYKKDCYLISYFGDQTFAWNDVSRIKPFRPHFSHMVKQNNMEEFHYAVDCALDEVSRRVEFGLACSCISKEAYALVKTQIIVNAGIREESSKIEGGDRFSSAASFDPFELVEKIKVLAESPLYSEVDRLQFVTSQAQLLAFNRWKGYSQLPDFQNLCGLLETDVEVPLSEEVKDCSELIGNDIPSVRVDKQVLSELEKPETQDGSSRKQNRIPGDEKVSDTKEKSLSELIAERRLKMQNGKRKLNSKSGDKLISSSPAKKTKAVNSLENDSALKQNKINASTGSIEKPLQSKQTFRVGASILKVASQLNGSSSTVSTPVLKHVDETSQKSAVNNKSKGKSSSGKSPGKKVFQKDLSSPNELLSQLCLAATDPLKGYSFMDSVVFFFREIRNLIAIDVKSSEMSEQSLDKGTDAILGEESTRSKITEKSDLTSIRDTCSGRIIQCPPEEQLAVDKLNRTQDVSPDISNAKDFSAIESQAAVQASPSSDSEQKCTVTDENLGGEVEKQVAFADESSIEDLSPTALILNFSDLESVPSVEDLNKIFSQYGPLVSPGAEVLKKSIRAKVAFRRHADAEKAFSSSGKYSIFGPSLVSYRLKRLASTPTKSSPSATKRIRTDETQGDGNST